ncbi:MAG TPA: hypothetical protein VG225_13915 [Terracidiphilus sp.]|nr:hypothetical protein [Terracidiphilus sp.]
MAQIFITARDSADDTPQGLKPGSICVIGGATEVAPLRVFSPDAFFSRL